MADFISISDVPYPWIKKELQLVRILKKDSKHKQVRLVQEWLCYHGFKTGVDQDFGPATEKQVKNFQTKNGLTPNGEVDEHTYAHMVAPILHVLTPIKRRFTSFAEAALAYAGKHLRLHPIEIGGQNKGPWVRLYMNGNQGNDYPWCAGFVSFILKQASDDSTFSMPIKGSWSCDSLAAQAKEAGIFIGERDLKKGRVSRSDLSPACVFLCRRTSTDWVHTGFATSFENDVFATIEGNTNDEGYREGYEACERVRSYAGKDFIKLT